MTKEQERCLFKQRLQPCDWFVVYENKSFIKIRHKIFWTIKIVEKFNIKNGGSKNERY